MKENREIESQLPQALTKEYQLKVLQNIEQRGFKTTRECAPNWKYVQNYLLGFTSKGGSTSCSIHCVWLGVDPDGYTFF